MAKGKPTVPQTCQQCSSTFLTWPYRLRAGQAKFCSDTCRFEHRRRQVRDTLSTRFWSRVDRSGDGCWPWTGKNRRKDGRGVLSVNNRPEHAPRVAWELTFGPIPDGLWILHECDNPPCCRPSHLLLGTPADNVADRVRRERSGKGDESWSRMHPERLARGERVASAKLTEPQVRAIRERYAAGAATQWELAHEYGVHQAAIWRIVRGRTWKHVA